MQTVQSFSHVVDQIRPIRVQVAEASRGLASGGAVVDEIDFTGIDRARTIAEALPYEIRAVLAQPLPEGTYNALRGAIDDLNLAQRRLAGRPGQVDAAGLLRRADYHLLEASDWAREPGSSPIVRHGMVPGAAQVAMQGAGLAFQRGSRIGGGIELRPDDAVSSVKGALTFIDDLTAVRSPEDALLGAVEASRDGRLHAVVGQGTPAFGPLGLAAGADGLKMLADNLIDGVAMVEGRLTPDRGALWALDDAVTALVRDGQVIASR